jgi:hypothetical protein
MIRDPISPAALKGKIESIRASTLSDAEKASHVADVLISCMRSWRIDDCGGVTLAEMTLQECGVIK